jgi:recombinational DNA repair protein RecR
MQTKESVRLYSPQLSSQAVISIRRLAWALKLNMPATVDQMVKHLPKIVDPSKVCNLCQDKSRCSMCVFNNLENTPETTSLAALM